MKLPFRVWGILAAVPLLGRGSRKPKRRSSRRTRLESLELRRLFTAAPTAYHVQILNNTLHYFSWPSPRLTADPNGTDETVDGTLSYKDGFGEEVWASSPADAALKVLSASVTSDEHVQYRLASFSSDPAVSPFNLVGAYEGAPLTSTTLPIPTRLLTGIG